MEMGFSCLYLTQLAIELLPLYQINYNDEYVTNLAKITFHSTVVVSTVSTVTI